MFELSHFGSVNCSSPCREDLLAWVVGTQSGKRQTEKEFFGPSMQLTDLLNIIIFKV